MDYFDKYNSLMKEATKFKKTDLNKSIEIIKEAINICPSSARFEGYFRLTKFLALANRNDEAIQEFNALLKNFDDTNLKEPFSTYSFVYLELSDFYYRQKDFKTSMKYGLLSFWNALIRTAINGQEDHLENLLSDKYNYPHVTKILKKIIGVDNNQFFKSLNLFVKEVSGDLIILAKRYNIVWNSKEYLDPPYYDGESSSQRMLRLLSNDSQFLEATGRVKETDFELFIEKEILILIN